MSKEGGSPRVAAFEAARGYVVGCLERAQSKLDGDKCSLLDALSDMSDAQIELRYLTNLVDNMHGEEYRKWKSQRG